STMFLTALTICASLASYATDGTLSDCDISLGDLSLLIQRKDPDTVYLTAEQFEWMMAEAYGLYEPAFQLLNSYTGENGLDGFTEDKIRDLFRNVHNQFPIKKVEQVRVQGGFNYAGLIITFDHPEG